MVVNGQITKFLTPRDEETGYTEFLFLSDYNKECPRFEALCKGGLPDVVPAVAMRVEFACETIEEIKKIDTKETKIQKMHPMTKKKYMNETSFACINYQDEEYAKKILCRVKGISAKRAEAILEAVDGDIGKLREHWTDEAFWEPFKGSRKYRPELEETVNAMYASDGLVKKYGRYGIGYPQADMLVTLFKDEAENRLCDNPYSIIVNYLGMDFRVADELAKDLDFSYMSQTRIKAIIRKVLSDNQNRGNTAMAVRSFYIDCARMHAHSAWEGTALSPYVILAAMSTMDDVYTEKRMCGYIKTLQMEADIASDIYRLMAADTSLCTPEAMFKDMEGNFNEDQMGFLKSFDKNSVSLLLGRGGTGKTHTICGAIKMYHAAHPDEEIKLCAPTARAAGVLKESSGYPSSTIHILLGLRPYSAIEEGTIPDNEHPLSAGLIVVDEMSMVDTELFWHLIKAVKTGAKVILSGDPNQLESVGFGSVLRDLISSGSVPKTTLKKIMRQGEGSKIVENCSRLLDGDNNFLTGGDFIVRRCASEREAKAYLLANYKGDKETTQILSTTKTGLIGTGSLNGVFEKHEKGGIRLKNGYFCKGDKVIFTRNNYDAGYCNGDVGYIESTALPLKISMQGVSGGTLEVKKEDTRDMEHADAITIHKSQGSEYENVFIMLPEKPMSLLNRNMANTAISRAKKTVTVITVNDALNTAVSNIYKRTRLTRLCEMLKNMSKLQKESSKEGETKHAKKERKKAGPGIAG